MDQLVALIDKIGGFVWGPFFLQPLLLGVGAFVMIGLGFMPLRRMIFAFRVLWKSQAKRGDEGELSPFEALMTSMAATVGTGNIVGVASAILIGGPGAVFWMWMTALIGMATKFCEAVLAVKYREVTPEGNYVGGPMYYIKNGLGQKWAWLGTIFAVFGAVACFGIGNMTQCNAITMNLYSTFGVPQWMTAAALFVLVGAVLLGGLQRIGAVAGKVVPFMAITYIIFGIIVMIMHAEQVPAAFGLIFGHAFTPYAAGGGAAGVAITKTIQMGVARGLFSNEAGLGSAPIAHATAVTDSPVRQGFLAMLDPFIDTILICTMTAIVILLSGQYGVEANSNPALLTAASFSHALPGTWGKFVVSGALVFFAFTTVLGWTVYGERCAIYLWGDKIIKPFRTLVTIVVPIGALTELNLVWSIADLLNGLMAVPNLIAVVLLSPVVFRMTKEYFAERAARDAGMR